MCTYAPVTAVTDLTDQWWVTFVSFFVVTKRICISRCHITNNQPIIIKSKTLLTEKFLNHDLSFCLFYDFYYFFIRSLKYKDASQYKKNSSLKPLTIVYVWSSQSRQSPQFDEYDAAYIKIRIKKNNRVINKSVAERIGKQLKGVLMCLRLYVTLIDDAW